MLFSRLEAFQPGLGVDADSVTLNRRDIGGRRHGRSSRGAQFRAAARGAAAPEGGRTRPHQSCGQDDNTGSIRETRS